jgi:hypothetical protein
MRPAAAGGFALLSSKNFSPRLQCDTGHFQNALRSARLTRSGFLRHCLACGRALQNCVRRASQLSTIVHHKQTRERRARPPGRVKRLGGRARIRAGFISASEDEP